MQCDALLACGGACTQLRLLTLASCSLCSNLLGARLLSLCRNLTQHHQAHRLPGSVLHAEHARRAIPCHVCGRVFEPGAGDTVVSDGAAAPTVGATTLGGYRIEQSLGGGGMGVVLLARDRDDRPVVIKAPR